MLSKVQGQKVMLGKIIKIISEGRISSIDKIADSIGVSHEITRVMLDDLVARGYLREVKLKGDGCKTPCKGCSGNCSCHSEEATVWELTEKVGVI